MGIYICIVSGLFWALFDLTRKISLKSINSNIILFLFFLGQTFIFLIWFLIDDYQFNLKGYILPGSFLIFISIISAIYFMKALKISELSLTIPLLSFTPLFSAILSALILKENLSSYQYLGLIFIIFGALILYSKSLKLSDIFLSIKLIHQNLGAKYMLLVSLLWSLTPIFDKICFKYSSISLHGFIQASFMMLIFVILSLNTFRKELKKIKKNFKVLFLTIFIGIIATILQFFAITLTLVPIMETLKRTIGQYCSVIFGKIYFKEAINKQKIFGIIFLSFGIYNILYKSI